ncbi:MAG: hypothetical protein K2X03_19785 [Bryobacteraceae bacterium]|nr:hypothetical protein [Bryobacteraceae bacterium]
MPRLQQTHLDALRVPTTPRVYLTLLDDASGGSLRVRKFIMTAPAAGRSREWYSTHPTDDRWTEIDRDSELTAEELLAEVQTELARWEASTPPTGNPPQ